MHGSCSVSLGNSLVILAVLAVLAYLAPSFFWDAPLVDRHYNSAHAHVLRTASTASSTSKFLLLDQKVAGETFQTGTAFYFRCPTEQMACPNEAEV